MPKFEIGLKKIRYGHAIVYAKDKEEAMRKMDYGDITDSKIYEGEDTVKLDCKQRESY